MSDTALHDRETQTLNGQGAEGEHAGPDAPTRQQLQARGQWEAYIQGLEAQNQEAEEPIVLDDVESPAAPAPVADSGPAVQAETQPVEKAAEKTPTGPATTPAKAPVAGPPVQMGVEAAPPPPVTTATPLASLGARIGGDASQAPEGSRDPAEQIGRMRAAQTAASATVAASLQAAQGQLAVEVQTRRAMVQQQITAAIAETQAGFQAERAAVAQDFAGLRQRVAANNQQQKAAAEGQGQAMKGNLAGRIAQERQAVATTVQARTAEAARMPEEVGAAAMQRIQAQAAQARAEGQAKAASYGGGEKGKKQGRAAMGVAEETAKEIEGRAGEVLEAVENAGSPLPDSFVELGDESNAQLDQLEPQLGEQVDQMVASAVTALDDQAAQAETEIDRVEGELLQQLDTAEADAIAGLEQAGAETEAQIDTGEAAAAAEMEAAAQRTEGQLAMQVDEAETLISTGQADPADVGTQMVAFLDGAAQDVTAAMGAAVTAVAAELDKAIAALTEGLAGSASQRGQGMQGFAEARAQTTQGLEQAAAEGAQGVVDQLGQQFDEGGGQLEAPIAQVTTDLDTAMGEEIGKARTELETGTNEALAKNDEALRAMSPKMDEAAGEAGWAHDHPILAGIKSVASFVGGLIVGIALIAVAVVVVIVALKLIVAGLVALGVSLVVAKILVAVVAIGAVLYILATTISAYMDQGHGFFMATLYTAGDFTGISDIVRCFTTEGATPFQRGMFLGQGLATIVSFVFAGRLDKAITARLPAKVADPALIVASRSGGKTAAGEASAATGGAKATAQVADDAARLADEGTKVADDVAKVSDDAARTEAAGGKGPSGKKWDDPALTQDDFIRDYRARYPKTTLDDAALAQRYQQGKRLNPETGRLRQVAEPKPVGALTDDPLQMSIDELLRDPKAQQRLHQKATAALDEVGSKLDEIAGRMDDVEAVSGLKRSSPDELVAAVQEKVSRKGYKEVGQMGDMVRGRIEANSESQVKAILDDLKAAFPEAQVDMKANSPYPRAHLDIPTKSGVRFELQVGTKSTTRFLETPGVNLPPRLARKVGKTPVDFHIAKYDVLDKAPKALQEKYGLKALSQQYDDALRQSGTGQFDEAAYKKITSQIEDVLRRMEKEDGDALLGLYTKGNGTADELVNGIGQNIKNNPLRQAYEGEVKALAERARAMEAGGSSVEEIARAMHQARRDLGSKYKDLTPKSLRDFIYHVNQGRYGDPLGPSFEFLAAKYKGDYSRIVDASTRPNPNVDGLLAKFRDWLIQQPDSYIEAQADDIARGQRGKLNGVDFTAEGEVVGGRVLRKAGTELLGAVERRATPTPQNEKQQAMGGDDEESGP